MNGISLGQVARGWDFQVNATNISVVQLGVNEALNITITITLWDVSSQTELAQTVVTASANTWVFGNLATSVPLISGRDYAVIGWATTNAGTGGPWYLFNSTPPAAFNPTGAIQFLDARYDNGIGPNTFPSLSLAPPTMSGVT